MLNELSGLSIRTHQHVLPTVCNNNYIKELNVEVVRRTEEFVGERKGVYSDEMQGEMNS